MGIPLRATIVRTSRTKIWEGLQEGKPKNYKSAGSFGAMEQADRLVQVCGSPPEQDEVMIFEEKVRLVSPFAMATEVLVNVHEGISSTES